MKFNRAALFIAWRYWRSKSADRFGRIVTWLGTIGIVLGVTALIVVLSIMNGLQQQQKDNVLSTLPHAMISQLAQNTVKRDQLPEIRPHFIQKVTPINQSQIVLQTNRGLSAANLIGVSEWQDDPLLTYLQDKPFDQYLTAGEYNIILPAGLARELKISIGEQVRVLLAANSQYTPFGRVPVQRLFTVVDILDNVTQSETRQLFANIQDVGRLLRIQPEAYQGFRLFLKDPFQITELPKYFDKSEWKINDWREQKGEFFQAVAMEKNMMGLLIGLIIVVAAANIVTSLSLMVLDKQGEIAILQTQGMTKGAVMQIFIFQGALVGFVGTLVGIVLGVLLASQINHILTLLGVSQLIYLPVLFDYYQLAIIVFFALGLTLLSTLYPAYRAAKIEPADALRYE